MVSIHVFRVDQYLEDGKYNKYTHVANILRDEKQKGGRRKDETLLKNLKRFSQALQNQSIIPNAHSALDQRVVNK